MMAVFGWLVILVVLLWISFIYAILGIFGGPDLSALSGKRLLLWLLGVVVLIYAWDAALFYFSPFTIEVSEV